MRMWAGHYKSTKNQVLCVVGCGSFFAQCCSAGQCWGAREDDEVCLLLNMTMLGREWCFTNCREDIPPNTGWGRRSIKSFLSIGYDGGGRGIMVRMKWANQFFSLRTMFRWVFTATSWMTLFFHCCSESDQMQIKVNRTNLYRI